MKAKLEKYGQQHLLRYYDELTEDQKAALLAQIDDTDFSVVRVGKSDEVRGVITPIPCTELDEINARRDEYEAAGLEEIRAGKVGAVLLAGGMGTRLGSDGPKGVYNIGVTRDLYIFECLFRNLMDVTDKAGNPIHLFIMTSDKNHDATVSFLNEKNYFGYDGSFVHFFRQEMAPAADYNGKVYLEDKFRLSTSPNGNGGWYSSMAKGGMLDIVRESGIEWLNVFAVDNVLQRIADPVFIGATKLANCVVGAKVIKKAAPDERVGVICLEDGHPSVVEYYELTDEMMNAKTEDGKPAYNFGVILNYLFHVPELSAIVDAKMPLHVVEKKIPCLDADGNLFKPEKPNGYKYETLILDMIHLLDSCLVFEVERKREFAPIKNPTGIDSVESARELLRLNGVEL
ncbi:MAG: UTP--glucose-1-phosphate uridylyltransferase [Clostridia bacterium]|nr:UTP--glucose-1-phosphate uridylyltransferase [Clostridia bacterium]MBQ2110482.1 UTP--glucose-1-phosphate uridylyltransferase [Clostridia bacterium]